MFQDEERNGDLGKDDRVHSKQDKEDQVTLLLL